MLQLANNGVLTCCLIDSNCSSFKGKCYWRGLSEVTDSYYPMVEVILESCRNNIEPCDCTLIYKFLHNLDSYHIQVYTFRECISAISHQLMRVTTRYKVFLRELG